MNSDQNAKILGTPFTAKWIAEKICKSENINSELRCWKATYIAEGVGMVAIIISLQMQWKNDVGLPDRVLLKILIENQSGIAFEEINQNFGQKIIGDEFQKALTKAHKVECDFYSTFKNSNPPCLIPKAYYQQYATKENDGIIIMEDLSEIGAIPEEFLKGLNIEQVLQVIDCLASLHAYSMKDKKWIKEFPIPDFDFIINWFKTMHNCASTIIDMKPDDFAQLFKQIEWIFEPEFLLIHVLRKHESLGIPPVLCHGDMHANNLLFKKNADGSTGDQLLSIVDWQVAHPGSCVEDICRLLLTSTTRSFRLEHKETVLRHYYDKLCENLGYVPFEYKTINELYDAFSPYGVAMYLFNIPIIYNHKLMQTEDREKNLKILLDGAKSIINDVIPLKTSFYDKCRTPMYVKLILRVLMAKKGATDSLRGRFFR